MHTFEKNGPPGWKMPCWTCWMLKRIELVSLNTIRISSASSEVTKTYKKHVLNDRRKVWGLISDAGVAPGVCYRFPYVVLYAKVKDSQKSRKASGNRTLVSWWLDLQCWKGKKWCPFIYRSDFFRQLERHFNWVRNMAQCFPAILLWC